MLLFTTPHHQSHPGRTEGALLGALAYLQDYRFGAFPVTSPRAFGLQTQEQTRTGVTMHLTSLL